MTSSKSTPPVSMACVILAAGKGTRMKSRIPKVLHKIAGRTMVHHVLNAVTEAGVSRAIFVVGHGADQVSAAVAPLETVIQEPQRGTGDAVKQAGPALGDFDGDVYILNGDGPFIQSETLVRMQAARQAADIVILGFRAKDPTPYGRMMTNISGYLDRIVETKEANPDELAVNLCNAGVFLLDRAVLFDLLDQVKNDNSKGEYYLTDIVEIAREAGLTCAVIECDEAQTMGINSRSELAVAEGIAQEGLRNAAMDNGATLLDPASVWFSTDTVLGSDVVVGQNVVFGPGVQIEDNVQIKPFCHLERCVVRSGAIIGPYARLRPGAEIGEDAHIGNFVEIKKASIEAGAKVNHLSYIGDARVGQGANIGAGTITCNYDGFNKHFTDIGANAFVGSDTLFIAPVKLGDGAMTGSGTVVTKNVPDNALAVTRPDLQIKQGWAERYRAVQQKKKDGG